MNGPDARRQWGTLRLEGGIQRCWLLVFLFTLLRGTPGRAQEPMRALPLRVEAGVVPEQALKDALEAELGIPMVLLDASAPVPSDLLSVGPSESTEVVVITFRDRHGKLVVREAPSLEDPSEALETVMLLASNLLRDEADGLVRELSARAREPQVSIPVPRRREDPRSVFDACRAQANVGVGIDLVPGVGSSSTVAGRAAVRRFSLGVLGSLSRGVRGVGLSGSVSIQREFMCGVQLSFVINLTRGSAQGVAWAQINSIARTLRGGALGALNLVRGEVRGVLLGSVNLSLHGLSGLTLGLFNLIGGRELRGLSAGLLNLATGEARGVQMGGFNLGGKPVRGAQLGLVNVSGQGVTGAQLGMANVALKASKGVQLGVTNVGGEVQGVQLGVFNYAQRASAQIGVVSIATKGRTALDVVGPSESGLTMMGAIHGSRYLHNLYYAGVRDGSAGNRFVLALGLGTRLLARKWLRLDLDLLGQSLYGIVSRGISYVPVLRMPFTIMFTRRFGVMLAPSYSLFVSQDGHEHSQAPSVGHTVFQRGHTRIEGWPGGAVGLRFELQSAR